jgi:hypothetical protein
MTENPDALTVEQLNAKIRELATLEPDPRVVAQKLLGDLRAADQRAVAAIALPQYVRTIMTSGHRHLTRPADQPRKGRTPGVFTAVDGKKYASARQRDLADWEVITGTSLAGPDGRKFFGEFTLPEVRWLSQERNRQAEALARQASRYLQVAEAMLAAGVERVRDLDRATLLVLMQEPAEENEVATAE